MLVSVTKLIQRDEILWIMATETAFFVAQQQRGTL
jgi:hypothetical protein